jgi:hypothetical protein
MVWDMAQRLVAPGELGLIRDVLLASTSAPGVCSPVPNPMLKVQETAWEIDGRRSNTLPRALTAKMLCAEAAQRQGLIRANSDLV